MTMNEMDFAEFCRIGSRLFVDLTVFYRVSSIFLERTGFQKV